jgi:predicted enzyme related to lactoylglutathione lyase
MSSIARFSLVALDTPDTAGMAQFYSAITGWEIEPSDSTDWIQLASDGGATIAFQEVEDHVPPVWPGSQHPQQAHIDFDVEDLDEGERAVLELGARKAEYQPGTTFRVFLDPSGHPFCLVQA